MKVKLLLLRRLKFSPLVLTPYSSYFMTLAPEHELVAKITTPEQKAAVEAYVERTAKRSERERMADVKTISVYRAFAEHPFTKEPVPV
jgi:leucyl-tRNA synthetase